MKISRDWLSDYIDLGGRSDDEVATRLTEIGHAVESVESHGDDSVFEIEFTTNRIDAMSHLGVARELAAAWGLELKFAPREPAPVAESKRVAIRIDAPDLCTRYSALLVEGVTVRPSSPKVQRRLEAVGLRPINNVVDATNYVMMSIGHPLHAFDLDKLGGPAIIVRAAAAGEVLTTLDGEKRTLPSEATVIADAERGVAIGGIMGGGNSEISDGTRNVLLECAHFEPGAIRRTARRLGMKTDASYRFERGADPGDTLVAILAAAELIVAEAGGQIDETIDVVARAPERRRLTLREAKLKEMSGGSIGIGYALELFTRLGMAPEKTGEGVTVLVPTFRVDLEQEIDLQEEALRFFGFNNVPASLPRLTTGDVRHDPVADGEERLRDLLVSLGLTETITYGFIHPEENAVVSDEKPLTVSNALTENVSSMRLSLLPGLLQTIAHNRAYGNRDGGVFEIGKSYHREGEGVRERKLASFAWFGAPPTHWALGRRSYDFFDARGVLEAIAHHFKLPLAVRPAEGKWLRGGQAAAAFSGDRRIALVGAVAPETLHRYDLKGDVFAAEIEVAELMASVRPWEMTEVSKFPGVPMVLPLLHEPSLQYETIAAKVRQLDVPYLREIGIWDRFVRDNAVPGEEVKTAIGLWYQAADRSLTQEEVNDAHAKLISRITELLPVKLMQG
jgi:phenylalanyl-tRNA synthetase beta chain